MKTDVTPLRRLVGWLILAWGAWLVAVVLTIAVGGARYYALDRVARAAHPWDRWLGSGSGGGVLLGLVGTGLMTAMLLYTLRKKFPRATWPGPLSLWLRFHVVCGITGPLFILLHAGLHLPQGLVAIAFWCMVLVALSGVFGRYVYGFLPRLASGRALGWGETRDLLADLHAEYVGVTVGSSSPEVGAAQALAKELEFKTDSLRDLVRLDRERASRLVRIDALLAASDLDAVARHQAREVLVEELRLKRSLVASQVGYRLFRYWHLFHRPLASAMYVIVALHVVFALLFGGSLGRVATLVAEVRR